MQFSTMPCQCPPECDVAGCPTPDEHFRKWCGICETYHRDLGPKSKFCCTCTGDVKGAEKDAKSNGESAEFKELRENYPSEFKVFMLDWIASKGAKMGRGVKRGHWCT